MGCCASKDVLSQELAAAFSALDDGLAAALAAGHIALLDARQLRSGSISSLVRRQDLPASSFLTPSQAVAALRSARRKVCFVSHAWRTVVSPDPDGATLAAVVRYLQSPLGLHVLGVFFDVASLHQHPRTAEQDAGFKAALKVMSVSFS